MHMKDKFNMQILKVKLYNSYAELFYRYTKLLSLSLIYDQVEIVYNWECALGISSFILP